MILSNNAMVVQSMARQCLHTVPVLENRINLLFHKQSEIAITKFTIEMGWLEPEAVREALHLNLLQTGRRSFEQHKKKQVEPDHTTSPHALAYAIGHGAVTAAEAVKIKFEHGETLRTFYVGVEKTLLKEIWHSLVEAMFETPVQSLSKEALNKFLEAEKFRITA